MIYLWNKFLLLICGCLVLLYHDEPAVWLIPVLSAIVLSAATGLIENKTFTRIICILYFLLCIYNSGFLFLLPLVLYDFMEDPCEPAAIAFLIPLGWHLETTGLLSSTFIIVLIIIGRLLKYYTGNLYSLKNIYLDYLDESKESAKILEEKNEYLIEKQDYEIKLATMNERNRIAREIHDNVGHMLSSALIQVGALTAVTDNLAHKEQLDNIKDTLSTGMDSIRSSIHNIHENSVDLHDRLSSLIKDFTFCEAVLDYNLTTDMPVNAKYAVIYIVKEALSNIMKHSNASKVSVVLLEQPALYQIIIQDNGSRKNKASGGMGISSMTERIEQLHGNISIRTEKGYRLFISLPKGGTKNGAINC